MAEKDMSVAVTLRERDYLQVDAESLERTLSALREWGGEIHERCDAASASLDQLKEALSETAPEAVQACVDGRNSVV